MSWLLEVGKQSCDLHLGAADWKPLSLVYHDTFFQEKPAGEKIMS